jgi:hypothetical protein
MEGNYAKSGYFGALSDKSQLFVRILLVLCHHVYNSRNQWVPHVHTYTVFQFVLVPWVYEDKFLAVKSLHLFGPELRGEYSIRTGSEFSRISLVENRLV